MTCSSWRAPWVCVVYCHFHLLSPSGETRRGKTTFQLLCAIVYGIPTVAVHTAPRGLLRTPRVKQEPQGSNKRCQEVLVLLVLLPLPVLTQCVRSADTRPNVRYDFVDPRLHKLARPASTTRASAFVLSQTDLCLAHHTHANQELIGSLRGIYIFWVLTHSHTNTHSRNVNAAAIVLLSQSDPSLSCNRDHICSCVYSYPPFFCVFRPRSYPGDGICDMAYSSHHTRLPSVWCT